MNLNSQQSNYVTVSERAWIALSNWYGGGRPILLEMMTKKNESLSTKTYTKSNEICTSSYKINGCGWAVESWKHVLHECVFAMSQQRSTASGVRSITDSYNLLLIDNINTTDTLRVPTNDGREI